MERAAFDRVRAGSSPAKGDVYTKQADVMLPDIRGRGATVAHQPSKLRTRVRFPSFAPNISP